MHRKKLLYLANGRKETTIAKLDERFDCWGLHVDSYWAYGENFPDSLDSYDGIFLSGSPHAAYEDIPFINREHELIQEAAKLSIPMLGICFGSQILASALCGRDQVFRRDFCEIGYKSLPVSANAKQDRIAHSLGESVYMFVWHNDEVRGDHPDMTILASSDLCPNQIWRYQDQPIWGIQGHPEITLEQSHRWFEENRAVMERDGGVIEELKASADEAAEAKTMLTNFAGLVARN